MIFKHLSSETLDVFLIPSLGRGADGNERKGREGFIRATNLLRLTALFNPFPK